MGDVLRFPVEMRVPRSGLEEDECGAVVSAACVAIEQGAATAVSVQNDGQYVCVFGRRGEPYYIGRVDCLCYLFDEETVVVAESIRFDVVLAALRDTLSCGGRIAGKG